MGPNPVSFVLRSLSCSILFLSLSYNFPTVESQFAGIVTVCFLPFFDTIILLYFSFSSFSPCLLSTSSLLLYPPKCESMRLHVLGLLCPLGSAQLLRVCGVRTSRCRSGRSGGLGVALLLLLLPQLLTNGSRGKQSPACLILPDYLAPPPPPLHPSWFSRHGRCQHQVRRHTLRRNSKEAGERKIDEAQVVRAECIFSHLLICMNKISLFFFFSNRPCLHDFFPKYSLLHSRLIALLTYCGCIFFITIFPPRLWFASNTSEQVPLLVPAPFGGKKKIFIHIVNFTLPPHLLSLPISISLILPRFRLAELCILLMLLCSILEVEAYFPRMCTSESVLLPQPSPRLTRPPRVPRPPHPPPLAVFNSSIGDPVCLSLCLSFILTLSLLVFSSA